MWFLLKFDLLWSSMTSSGLQCPLVSSSWPKPQSLLLNCPTYNHQTSDTSLTFDTSVHYDSSVSTDNIDIMGLVSFFTAMHLNISYAHAHDNLVLGLTKHKLCVRTWNIITIMIFRFHIFSKSIWFIKIKCCQYWCISSLTNNLNT